MATNQYHQRSDATHQRLHVEGLSRDLLREVKTIAARRGISLKQLVTELLQRLVVESREGGR